MEVSIFLAEFWGWYFILFFAILSFNPSRIKQMITDLSDEKFLLLGALIAVVIGLLNVLSHNIWELSWKLIITLIGWIALLKGILLFSFPKPTISWLKHKNIKYIQLMYILFLLLGLFLLNIVYKLIPYQ